MNIPRKGGWPLRGIMLQRYSQPEISHKLLVRVMPVKGSPNDHSPCIARHGLASLSAASKSPVELATDLQVARPDVHPIHEKMHRRHASPRASWAAMKAVMIPTGSSSDASRTLASALSARPSVPNTGRNLPLPSQRGHRCASHPQVEQTARATSTYPSRLISPGSLRILVNGSQRFTCLPLPNCQRPPSKEACRQAYT